MRLIVSGLAVFITCYLLPGADVDGFVTALIVAVVLGLVNIFIKPILLVLTLPITLVTLGLFTLVINALMVLLVDYLVPGFNVTSFWWALAFAFVLSIINWFLNTLTK